MRGLIRFLLIFFFLLPLTHAEKADSETEQRLEEKIENLQEPLYSPFIERYLLDELKQLRTEMLNLRAEMFEKVAEKELKVANDSINYVTNTVSYFFYMIAGVSSILVLVGWTSIIDIKRRVHITANEQISAIISEYESRLRSIEAQLSQKTKMIDENAEEIGLTNEIHSLWLRASQENSPQGKIEIYDQILSLRIQDVEALTYKADAVLELQHPQWAINLCRQALEKDPENAHAFYQLACAYAYLDFEKDVLANLEKAIKRSDSYRQQAKVDEAFAHFRQKPEFKQLVEVNV